MRRHRAELMALVAIREDGWQSSRLMVSSLSGPRHRLSVVQVGSSR